MIPERPLTVIIPTCESRHESLSRTLAALAGQDTKPAALEVIVVIDGLAPRTTQFLEAYRGLPALRWKEQPPSGPGVARNTGAAMATCETLLFLDDDIEAEPALIRTHLNANIAEDQVCIGNLETIIPPDAGFLATGMRRWWDQKFVELATEGHRFDYTDLLSGHFSISKKLFERMGGFDPTFTCREDYELGARLLKAGSRFQFLREARGRHHERPILRKTLRRAMYEGAGDIRLAKKHPELARTLRATRDYKILEERRRRARRGKRSAPVLESVLVVLERLNWRRTWRHWHARLKRFWYHVGAIEECSNVDEIRRLVEKNPDKNEADVSVDLRCGFARTMSQIEKLRPQTLKIMYGPQSIGNIAATAIAEPITPAHFKLHFYERCAYEFFLAKARERFFSPHPESVVAPELYD